MREKSLSPALPELLGSLDTDEVEFAELPDTADPRPPTTHGARDEHDAATTRPAITTTTTTRAPHAVSADAHTVRTTRVEIRRGGRSTLTNEIRVNADAGGWQR